MKHILSILLAAMLVLSSTACTNKESGSSAADSKSANDLSLTRESKPAGEYTAQSNAAMYYKLDFDDKQETEFAARGLINAPETLELTDEDGKVIWSQAAYCFLEDYEKASDTVNPSLWAIQ